MQHVKKKAALDTHPSLHLSFILHFCKNVTQEVLRHTGGRLFFLGAAGLRPLLLLRSREIQELMKRTESPTATEPHLKESRCTSVRDISPASSPDSCGGAGGGTQSASRCGGAVSDVAAPASGTECSSHGEPCQEAVLVCVVCAPELLSLGCVPSPRFPFGRCPPCADEEPGRSEGLLSRFFL